MVAIVDAQSTAVTALGDGSYRIDKTAGSAAFDASAVSAAAIAGDCVLRVRDLSAPNSLFFGLSIEPGEGLGFGQMDYSAHLYGGDLYVYERGVYVPTPSTHAGTAWIVRSGSVLTYLIGDHPATALVARSVSGVTAPLWFDSSISKEEGAIEVRFEPPGSWCEPPFRAPQALEMTFGSNF
ncbi:hypothetical protein [Sphingomonas sp.]|jgi:hypothetical protein|uniref:hypothetical protein n=1 Tax=Sphingomonas sp. TaxID=28214 RepID=UPI002EDB538B